MADFTINIPKAIVPEGYIPLAFRPPFRGEKYIDDVGDMIEAGANRDWPRLILQKKPPVYREPTLDDVGKWIQVRPRGGSEWTQAKLIGLRIPDSDMRFLTVGNNKDGYAGGWSEARIEVTE